MPTLKQLATEALAVQNASNIFGLSCRFAEVVLEVKAALEAQNVFGNDAVARHPIVKLWASKLHDLACMGLSEIDRYGEAYAECRRLSESSE